MLRHQVHADCFDRYHASVLSRGPDAGAQLAQSGLGADDFHCPTCRRLCNAVVPVMPATASQLRSYRDARAATPGDADETVVTVDGDGSGPDDPSAATVRVVTDGLNALDETLRDARRAALAASLLADREAAKIERKNSSADEADADAGADELADPIPGSDSPRARSSRNSRSSVDGGGASAENTRHGAHDATDDGTVPGILERMTERFQPHPYWSKHPGRFRVGAHLAERLVDAAREGPLDGHVEGPEPSALARDLAPWLAVLHGNTTPQ